MRTRSLRPNMLIGTSYHSSEVEALALVLGKRVFCVCVFASILRPFFILRS